LCWPPRQNRWRQAQRQALNGDERFLSHLGAECAQLKLGQRCAVITDSNVGRHFAKAALKSLAASGFEPVLISIPAARQ